MATATLAQLVQYVRAEAGHSLLSSQGVNSLDTIKYLIDRTEEELYEEYQWPQLILRADTTLIAGQYLYPYPASMGFVQIREAWYGPSGSTYWYPVDHGIPESFLKPDGTNVISGGYCQRWDVVDEQNFRIWPTPSATALLRFKGMKPRVPLVSDNDVCTLDKWMIVLFVAAELLDRAKAQDAKQKLKKAETYKNKLLADTVSAKNKISTFGTGRFTTRDTGTNIVFGGLAPVVTNPPSGGGTTPLPGVSRRQFLTALAQLYDADTLYQAIPASADNPIWIDYYTANRIDTPDNLYALTKSTYALTDADMAQIMALAATLPE